MKTTEAKKDLQRLALLLTVNCVRNTVIEEYHIGTTPLSKTGDYTDVKVVTPYGEIPWNELSRISDDEMKAFNKEVVNKVYTLFQFMFNPELPVEQRDEHNKLMAMNYPDHWDAPEMDQSTLEFLNIKE